MQGSVNTIPQSGLGSQLDDELCNYLITSQFLAPDPKTHIPEENIKRYSPEPQKPNRTAPKINENSTHKPKPPTVDQRSSPTEDLGAPILKKSTSKVEIELGENNGIFYEKKVQMDSGLPIISPEDHDLGYMGQGAPKLGDKKADSKQDTVITEEMSKGKFSDFEKTQSSIF